MVVMGQEAYQLALPHGNGVLYRIQAAGFQSVISWPHLRIHCAEPLCMYQCKTTTFGHPSRVTHHMVSQAHLDDEENATCHS